MPRQFRRGEIPAELASKTRGKPPSSPRCNSAAAELYGEIHIVIPVRTGPSRATATQDANTMMHPAPAPTAPARPRAPRQRRAPAPFAFCYTLPDASAMAGLSQMTLRRRAAEGALVLRKVGRRRLVDGDSLRRLLGITAD
jgi:hypothetical protein